MTGDLLSCEQQSIDELPTSTRPCEENKKREKSDKGPLWLDLTVEMQGNYAKQFI